MLSLIHEGLAQLTPTNSNDVTKVNKSLNRLRKLILYLKYTLLNIVLNYRMKIVACIPLIQEIKNSVDFLNLIPNVEEHNLELVDVLNRAT